MEFWDCNISYGPDTMKGQLPGCPGLNGLIAQLDRAGVTGGLVYYAMEEPILGNATLACDLQTYVHRLFGVWSILPSCTGETPPPSELPALMKQNGIAALTVNPQANRFLPRPSAIGDYLDMACERAIPVILNTGRGITISEADDLMGNFPGLTVILSYKNCWPNDRTLRPFLRAYKNLYLDMTSMQTAAGLASITDMFPAERILFGSGFPESYMGSHMTVIKHAPVGDGDRALIAGGNLRRILKGARYG